MKDVFTLVESYMNKIFSGIDGMKLLLVDRETVKFSFYFKAMFYIILVWNHQFGHVSIKTFRA